MIFVDTNVLMDLVTDDPIWSNWSLRQLEAAALSNRLMINSVVYAEFSIRFSKPEEVDAVLAAMRISMAEVPRAAMFLAGKAFQRYRRQGGTKTGVLPDFFIGAHAAAVGARLVTRDVGRYRTYFPTVELVTPN